MYDEARSIYEASYAAARASRAFRRAKVVAKNTDGSYDLEHEGGTVTVMPDSGTYSVGETVNAVKVDGVLSISNPSAYGGGRV